MSGAAVAQVVPVDAGNDDVSQLHCGNRAREIRRLVGIGRLRPAVRHSAERAAARAQVAKDHEGRGALAETFAYVRAGGFLADGMQVVVAQRLLDFLEARAAGRLDADPVRLFQRSDRNDLDRIAGGFLLAGLAFDFGRHVASSDFR